MYLTDTWFGMEGTLDDKPYLIRGRENIISFRKNGKHKFRIDIIFQYVTDDTTGMPDESQLKLMDQVEECISRGAGTRYS